MKQPADAFPLSPTQLALWRSGRGEEIISLRFRTDALATADRAGEAIGTLVARHEILRTACVVPPGFEAPLQRIGAGAAQDHYRIVGADNAAQAEPWLDPGKGHNTLLVVGEGWLEIRQPRLVADLYSLAHLADELAGLLAGEYPSGALPPQYADVAQWLLDLAEDPKAAPGRAFWERSGSPDSDSPGLYPLPRPAGTASGPLLPDLVQRLRRRAGEWNAPPDTILLAGWAGFLSRLFGAGLRLQVRLDGRAEAALREALGPLERFVPLAKTDAAAGLRDIHQRQERWLRDAVKWQDCFPSNGGATKSWEPATLFSLLPEPRRRDAGIFSEPSPAALELRVQPLPGGYSLEFAGRELDAGTAGHLLEAFTGLLERMLDDPAANVVTLPCVRPAQRDELSALSSITVDEPVVPGRITDQILAQAREHPSRVALAGPDRSLNYVELERESREMAAVLVGEGVAPGDTVGVRCRSTEAALIAMLAILRCGAVYVPLDLRWPSQRLEAAVGQATVRYLVSDDGLKLPVGVTVIDSGARHPDAGPLNTPDPKPDALAYIIFTSGSSGRPKGVCVSHANLAASTAARGSVYPGCVQRFLLLSPLAFDSSIAGIFWTLSQGGTLVLPAEGVERSPAEMLALIRDAGVTEFLCLPSLYRALAEAATPTDLAGVKRIIVAGESCPAELMRLHHERAPGTELYNEYGPSEATVWATVVRLDNRKDDGVPVSIGRAIPGAQVYVMDAAGELLPPGVAGELVIGGAGVAAGYCGPQAEGMSPFRSARIDADQRLYHSGDRGVLLSDGEFRFLGRLDRQVKVRGQRVEPEEIEAALRALPQVRAAAVIARPARGDSGSRLDALVEADTDHDWRNALRGAVPDYMVPGKIVSVPVIPRLANGKCDYRGAARLLDDGARTRGGEPRGEIEQQLAEIWKKLLGLEAVGREDGFFENGGDSILAIRMIALLQQKGLRLAPRQVFATPRLGVLAQHVQPLDPASGARASLPAGPFPLSPIQAYFLEQEPINPGHRNVARLLAPTAVLNPDRVGMLAAGLVERHATLRMRFSRAKTGWQQAYVQPGEGTVFAVEDLRGLDRDSFGEAVAQRCTRLQGSLNIETGPMFRMVLFQGQDEQRLLLLAHHLVADPVSLQVIVDDLSQALGAGGTLGAGPQPAPFHVWVAALERYGRSERLANQRAYWRGQAAPDSVRLPERSTCDGGRRVLSRRVGPAWLAGGAKVAGREVQARIVAALAGAVAGLAGQGPVRIDIEGHGRESAAIGSDIGGSVGWFTSLYPLRIDGAGDEALGRVRSALDGVPDGGIGFGVMQRQEKGLAPWAQVACNYLGRGTVAAENFLFCDAPEVVGPLRDPDQPPVHALTLVASVTGQELLLEYFFDAARLEAGTVAALADEVTRRLRHLPMVDNKTLSSRGIRYPLTPVQTGLLFHSIDAADPGLYVTQTRYRLRGELQPERLERCWQAVIARHSALRTGFCWRDSEIPMQKIFPVARSQVRQVDLRARGPEAGPALERLAQEERGRGFDLERPPLMRALLARTGDRQYDLLWTAHHLIMDGWSSRLIWSEILSEYHDGKPPESPASSYRDYVDWVLSQDLEAAEHFWRRALAGFESPPAREPVVESAPHRRMRRRPLPVAHSAHLESLARENDLSVAALVNGLWGLVLCAREQRDAVVFGVTTSGRPAAVAGIERLVGLFINTLPMRVAPVPELDLIAFFRQIAASVAGMLSHEYTPLYRLQRWFAAGPAQPLFKHVLLFESFPGAADGEVAGGLTYERIPQLAQNNYPLTLRIVPGEEWQTDVLFDAATVDGDEAELLLDGFSDAVRLLAEEQPQTVAAVLAGLRQGGARRHRQRQADRHARGRAALQRFMERGSA